LTDSVIVGACVAAEESEKWKIETGKLKIKTKTGIQNGRLNAGICFHPRLPSILSTPKTKNRSQMGKFESFKILKLRRKTEIQNKSASGAEYL
jgi:hypothetical protein